MDEFPLQIIPRERGSSLISPTTRSGLIARGRSDAAVLAAPLAESEEQRTGFFPELLDSLDDRPTTEIQQDAEMGDPKYQTALGFRYRFGVERDFAESARWLRKAADQCFPPAQFNLGWAYDNIYLAVQGVGEDQVEAAKWYLRAADQGYAPAQFNLGVMYDNGEGVAQDYTEAVKWYRKAAEKGLDHAQFNLGLKYYKGQGVAQNYAETAKWYREAANQGLSKAQFNLGLIYYNGQGVVQNCVEAITWMALAAAYANDDNAKRYAMIRANVAEKMSPAQIVEAYRLTAGWYRKAADQDDSISFIAKSNLGLLYESGEGLAQDYVQAYMWMNLAALQTSDAKYAARRDRLAARMKPAQIAEAQRLAREWTPAK